MYMYFRYFQTRADQILHVSHFLLVRALYCSSHFATSKISGKTSKICLYPRIYVCKDTQVEEKVDLRDDEISLLQKTSPSNKDLFLGRS